MCLNKTLARIDELRTNLEKDLTNYFNNIDVLEPTQIAPEQALEDKPKTTTKLATAIATASTKTSQTQSRQQQYRPHTSQVSEIIL
ncbi:hypothetical protein [Vibrio harveyi]|uniref:hypothetical protein n=1 Tax=Vibrio harveyi TaxID=669 RepID=UPI00390AAAA4